MSSGDRKRGSGDGMSAPQATGLTVNDIMGNPGLLKLELLLRGLRVQPQLLANLIKTRGPSAFATAFELDLMLPEGTGATVPVDPKFTSVSPYHLVKRGDAMDSSYDIECDDVSVPVTLIPPPLFYSRTTESGIPMGRFATLHGSYLALSPISECQFLGSSDQCQFCSLDGTLPGMGPRMPVYELVDAVKAAQEERAIQMIYLSVGYIEGSDSGVAALEPYVRALKKSFNVLVAVDALPPSEDRWIDRTYAMGVDSVSYNLEIFDPDAFERICPGPARHIGRQRFLDALSYATTVFNPGAVICHLVVGMEPVESTLAGIDELVRRQVVPVLPTYRPFKGIDLRSTADSQIVEFTTESLSSVYAHLYQRLRENQIPMGWVRDISVVTTPMEGRFFVGQQTRLVGIMERLFNDPHRKPHPRLVDLRRTLRVQETES
jgi:sodium-dependent dicarboxylate transporter 2/3/5